MQESDSGWANRRVTGSGSVRVILKGSGWVQVIPMGSGSVQVILKGSGWVTHPVTGSPTGSDSGSVRWDL